jgi:hypothetical protein
VSSLIRTDDQICNFSDVLLEFSNNVISSSERYKFNFGVWEQSFDMSKWSVTDYDEMNDIYFDTPDHLILKSGVWLRLRSSKKKGYVEDWSLRSHVVEGEGTYVEVMKNDAEILGNLNAILHKSYKRFDRAVEDMSMIACFTTKRKQYCPIKYQSQAVYVDTIFLPDITYTVGSYSFSEQSKIDGEDFQLILPVVSKEIRHLQFWKPDLFDILVDLNYVPNINFSKVGDRPKFIIEICK